MIPRFLVILATLFTVVGVGLLFVKHWGPEPAYSCLQGQQAQGISVLVDGQECVISNEVFSRAWEYEHSSALWIRQTGLGLVVTGLATGIASAVKTARSRALSA